MKKLFVLFVAVVLLGSLILAGCGGTDETTTTAAPTTLAPTTTAPPVTEAPTTTVAAAVTITWDQAIDYEGKTATVTGPVVAVVDMGAGIAKYIIQIGSEGDDGFNATVEYPSADKFGGAPALSTVVGKLVEVTGEVYVNPFELKAEILLTDAAQFKIVGDAPAADAPLTADEAKAHYGEEGSVTGTVKAILDLGAGPGKWLIQLDATEDGAGFNGMIQYANIAKFGDLNALVGKTLVLTGMILENGFQKKGEIELIEPAQMVVVEAVAYTADEAKAHYGEEGSVTGTVKAILDLGAGPGKWLIQLDATEDGAGFNGMIQYANIAKFGDLNALVGKTLVLTGMILENGFQKKGEIELIEPAQMVVK